LCFEGGGGGPRCNKIVREEATDTRPVVEKVAIRVGSNGSKAAPTRAAPPPPHPQPTPKEVIVSRNQEAHGRRRRAAGVRTEAFVCGPLQNACDVHVAEALGSPAREKEQVEAVSA